MGKNGGEWLPLDRRLLGVQMAHHTSKPQRELIESLSFLEFEGPIKMKGAEQEFWLFEEWEFQAHRRGICEPNSVHMGRFVGASDRDSIGTYDLKKRKYICTTSMDAELALITANITLAAPGRLMYDPFVGSGSFPVACAHFGALVFGSDIDGRSIRGKGEIKPPQHQALEVISICTQEFNKCQ
ncbi:putative tRNA guanosine-2'-O-methyltransferase TRM11 [Glarea lozoyensis 74030]|uniref:Putative tRNA guanosine-2'-O-methyltransferase TRM11 n=1 Tax=Glarea lozoyensis (strain ATCC 74030 / MF5533) TaxID=1104152 RepID=H0EJQ7_GLAL7|nr:putative tRNA guanosine-2'-O-methyltransferase TRM11 [Glarea lozoyensis 74030]